MYCGHAHLRVWLFVSDIAVFVLKRDVKLEPTMCVCPSVRGRMPTLLHGPGCNLGNGRGCP